MDNSLTVDRSRPAWERRLLRLRRRLSIRIIDLRNDLLWYGYGGRFFFRRYWRELAGSHRWVFILGCNNSGTSLLQRLLEWTGEVSTFPAEGQLYTRAVPRDRDRRYARIWTQYADQLKVTRGTAHCPRARLVHDWLVNLPQPLRPVIVEKTPVNTLRAQWLQEVFPNACFIGLVRDGRAVAEGIRRKGGQPLDAGARHWRRVNELMLEQAAQLREFHLIRYEELTDRPADTVFRLCRTIGIASERVEALADSNEMAASTAMATVFGPVRNHNAEALQRLSAADLAVINAQAGDALRQFGYLDRPSEAVA